MSLYDLFGFTEEERRIAQTGGKPRRRNNRPKLVQPRQPSLFDLPAAKSETPQQTAADASASVYPVENAVREEANRRIDQVERQIREDEAKLSAEERQRKHEEEMQPRPFEG